MSEPDHMTPKSPLSFATIFDTIKALGALVVTMSGAFAVILTATWWIMEPRVRPYLRALEDLKPLAERVDQIEARVPEMQVLEFKDVAEVEPQEIKAGGRITITYTQRRNFTCQVMVYARFYSVQAKGFDVDLGYEFRGTRAQVMPTFEPFSIVLTLPEAIAPGRWGYAPEIVPSDDCKSVTPIYPPPAYFTVTQ
jgi:hypothetical protein